MTRIAREFHKLLSPKPGDPGQQFVVTFSPAQLDVIKDAFATGLGSSPVDIHSGGNTNKKPP